MESCFGVVMEFHQRITQYPITPAAETPRFKFRFPSAAGFVSGLLNLIVILIVILIESGYDSV